MPDLSPEHRARLEAEANYWQQCAAEAHSSVIGVPQLATMFQSRVRHFSRRARECLFALIGSDHEERLAFVGAALILAELYVGSWVFA